MAKMFLFKEQYYKIWVCFLLAVVFCWPILLNLGSLGTGDWDQVFFYHEAAQVSFYHYHQLPLWNPWYNGGVSIAGNPQSAFFSPLSVFTSMYGVVVGMQFGIVFCLFIGLLGMFLLSRYLGLRPVTSLLAAVIFVFNGALTLHLAAGHLHFLPVVYLPFVLLFLLKSKSSIRYLPAASLFLALMFYQGGTYVVIFSIISLLIYALIDSVRGRNIGMLWRFVVFFIMAFLLAGFKTFPVADYISHFQRLTGSGWALSFSYMKSIFLEQPGLMIGTCFRGFGGAGWWEMGAYVGLIPVILFMSAVRLFRTQTVLLLTGIIMFLISLGNFAPLSPWSLLHHMPPFNNMVVASRAMIIAIFYFALLSGFVIEKVYAQLGWPLLKRWLPFIILGLVLVDLVMVNSPVFREAFPGKYILSSVASERCGVGLFKDVPFVQHKVSSNEKFSLGAWSAMHLAMLHNQGTLNGYESIPVTAFPAAEGEAAYRGEQYLLGEYGQARLHAWSPNRIVIDIKVLKNDILIVNQNYEKGWHSSAGPVMAHDGLMSVVVNPSVRQVVFWYFPFSLVLGWFAVSIGLVLAIVIQVSGKVNTPIGQEERRVQ
ncbi:MAG: hypothetical protein V2A70_07515 [Candidatus Omnitrophota bacterium]